MTSTPSLPPSSTTTATTRV
ncbi:hypothetical protein LINPERPRIM_LOCUS23386 [Linum perenne]